MLKWIADRCAEKIHQLFQDGLTYPCAVDMHCRSEPGDQEMLGMWHVVLGDEKAASTIFREGLAIEFRRNPQSDLCGSLMKRISLL